MIKGNLAHDAVTVTPPSPYIYSMGKEAVAINEENKIELTVEQEAEFAKSIKIGVLKQLCQKGFITDMQLNQLIEMQK